MHVSGLGIGGRILCARQYAEDRLTVKVAGSIVEFETV
jgi:hypothetical protein